MLNPPRVIGYVRVSTDEQQQGPRAQRDEIERWCAARGAELVAVYEDCGVSGATAEHDDWLAKPPTLADRPGLLSALDALDAGMVLLVAKRDRLARQTMLAAMVERLVARVGASIAACNGAGDGDGPEARLMRTMIDAFSEYEREIIRARTRAALAAKQARGELTGSAPVGKRRGPDGCSLVTDEAEARAIEIIRELRAEGYSQRDIAAELNARGVAARGARWHATTVARVLARVAA